MYWRGLPAQEKVNSLLYFQTVLVLSREEIYSDLLVTLAIAVCIRNCQMSSTWF